MKAVILAGGLGKRLRPFTQAIPKSLLPVGEQSLLELQISNLAKHGCRKVILATNYKSEYVSNFIGDGSRFGVEIRYSEERKPLGTCGPLSLLRDEFDAPFLMLNGDILTTMDFERFYRYGLADESDLTVATKKIRTPFNFGSVGVQGNRIVRIDEKPELQIEVVAGIYFIRPALLELVPDGEYYGIDRMMQELLGAGRPIGRYLMDEYWLDIGRVEDYRQAEDAYRTHFK